MLLNKTFALIIAFSLLFPSRIFPSDTLAPAGMAETGLLMAETGPVRNDSKKISVLVNIAVDNLFILARIEALEKLVSSKAVLSLEDIDRLMSKFEFDLKEDNREVKILEAELLMLNVKTLDIERYLKLCEKLMEVTEGGIAIYRGYIYIIVAQMLINKGNDFSKAYDYNNAYHCYALATTIKKTVGGTESAIREKAAEALCKLAEAIKDKSDLTGLYKSSLFLVFKYADKEFVFNEALDKAASLLTDVSVSGYVLELIDIVLERPYLIRKPNIFNVIVRAVNQSNAEVVIKKLTKALDEIESLYQFDFAKLLGNIGKHIMDFNSQLALKALVIDLLRGYTDDSKEAAGLIARNITKNDTEALNSLFLALSDTREDVGKEVAIQLGLLKNLRAVEHLKAAMRSSSSKNAPEAAEALGNIGTENAINALMKAIRFRTGRSLSKKTRIAAIKALGVALSGIMGKVSTAAEAIHNEGLINKGIETLIAASRWGRKEISAAAIYTLVNVSGEEDVRNCIFSNLTSRFGHKRLTAVEALGWYVHRWKPTVESDTALRAKINKALFKALHHKKDKEVRMKAIEAYTNANIDTSIGALCSVIETKSEDRDLFKKAVESVAALVEINDKNIITQFKLDLLYNTFKKAYQQGGQENKEALVEGIKKICKVLNKNSKYAIAHSFVKIYKPEIDLYAYVSQQST